MEYKIESMAKGTRIITGQQAKDRRNTLNKMIEIFDKYGYNEIILPIIEKTSLYTDKAGDEIKNQMYIFDDKGGRSLCLRPEGTATIQKLANKHLKTQKDVMFWYFTPCYRYERPQKGRYREFYQLGVEIINPSDPEFAKKHLIDVAKQLIEAAGVTEKQIKVSDNVKRGFAYYNDSKGFEIAAKELGSQKQICGGGAYKEGIGFAIGFDRLMLMKRTA